METIALWIAHYGYMAIFLLLVLGIVGLPVPDEWLLTFAGYLIYKGHLQFWPAFAAAALGSMCGITVSYGLGRSLGLFLIHHYGRLFRVSQKDLDRVHSWFDRFGRWTLLFGYYVPGVRHFTAVVAGTSKMEYHLFAVFAYAGALIWTTTFVWLGYGFGDQWSAVLKAVERHLTVCAWVILVLLVLFLIRWYAKKRAANGV
ncbi:MAG TPA: DedA family protein [Acidobacteriota bacterium]|nr:DedA family protein [Acidobacteriota bacterium]